MLRAGLRNASRTPEKLKTGLSQRKEPCKNLLCLRVQGRGKKSVRNQDKVSFQDTWKFKSKGALGPGQSGLGPEPGSLGTSDSPSKRPRLPPPPHMLDSDPATIKTQAFYPG